MRFSLRSVGRDTSYVLIAFPLSVIAFVFSVAGLSAGIGTAVLGVVSVIIMFATFSVARFFADVERRALPEVLGVKLPRAWYRPVKPTANWFQRLWHPVTQLQSWLDLLHAIVILPFSIAAFAVGVTWWAVALYGLAYPLFGWILHRLPDYTDLPELIGIGDSLGVRILFHLTIGVVAAATLPVVLRGVTLIRAGVSRTLLTGLAEYRLRVDDVTPGREDEASVLRRLERDLQDGPQQRLASLATELAQVRRQLARDPQAADARLAQAITQTQETLDVLRTLSRDVAPPILAERGLTPALAVLASRAPLPVELDITVDQRYPAAVENAIYFVVAESLANIAKHSEATQAIVSLRDDEGMLLLLISDNGKGGADTAKGQGLAGLAERLRTVGGDLTVQSPAGGPTVIGAQIPSAPDR